MLSGVYILLKFEIMSPFLEGVISVSRSVVPPLPASWLVDTDRSSVKRMYVTTAPNSEIGLYELYLHAPVCPDVVFTYKAEGQAAPVRKYLSTDIAPPFSTSALGGGE
jgi:hypothetical protein